MSELSQSFKDLDAWKMALRLNESVYLLTRKLPNDASRAAIAMRLRKASVSIAANIAEGAGSGCNKSFAQMLGSSCAACLEVEGQLLLVKSLYANLLKEANNALNQLITVSNMIKLLQTTLRV